MTERDYTKREIDGLIREIHATLSSQDETLDRIEAQTTLTNGSVRLLQKFMWSMGGAIVVLGWLVSNNLILK